MADAKPAVERLSEDESLRGDLSDIGFGPLLDWAVAAVTAYAPKAADSDTLDAYTNRIRGVVQSAVQAAQDSKLDDPNALLDFDPADREKVLAALKAVTFGDDPDENAVQIAAALQSGLTSGASVEPPAPVPEAAAPSPAENNTTAAEATAVAATAIKAAAGQEAAQEAPEQPTAVKPSEPAPAVESKQEAATEPAAAQPQKKNEEAGEESARPPLPPEKSLNPETPANPAPSNPRPGTFLDTLRSTVGQTYNSAWGIFKGLSKRRSG